MVVESRNSEFLSDRMHKNMCNSTNAVIDHSQLRCNDLGAYGLILIRRNASGNASEAFIRCTRTNHGLFTPYLVFRGLLRAESV